MIIEVPHLLMGSSEGRGYRGCEPGALRRFSGRRAAWRRGDPVRTVLRSLRRAGSHSAVVDGGGMGTICSW